MTVPPTVITVGVMIFDIPVQRRYSQHVVTRLSGAEFPIHFYIYIYREFDATLGIRTPGPLH